MSVRVDVRGQVLSLSRLGRVALVGAVIALSACHGSSQVAGGSSTASPRDVGIVNAGDGIILGSGWYPLEHYRGLTFQWSRNDAEITACPDANDRTLAVLMEPGPGVGSKPFRLTITGNHGDQRSMIVRGREYVKIDVGANVPAETFVFHAQTRNLPTPGHDPRILNFRALDVVLGSSIADCSRDVVHDASPLALGSGWYPLESFGGERFRWVNNDAQITLTSAQPRPFTIEADVEPGPSLGGSPLSITVRGQNGRTLASSAPVPGRSFVTLALPAEPANTRLTLSVRSKNVRVPNDPRMLNFRVFDLKVKP